MDCGYFCFNTTEPETGKHPKKSPFCFAEQQKRTFGAKSFTISIFFTIFAPQKHTIKQCQTIK